MIFTATTIAGAYVIDLERTTDERGFFARTFSTAEFDAHGLDPRVAQCSVSYNPRRLTLRGMHYQVAPHEEAKLIRCTRGAVFDVIVDLRRESPSFRQWFGAELSADSRRSMFVPPGCAHGLLTLVDDTEVLYQISTAYAAESARGVRWNDTTFGIQWPERPRVISARDRDYPDFA
jgi:dTDP-4-dehydrorhamnose 3,5-epimerase